ncbi:MAG: family 43 glycosylhydrolase [Breznakibacter sp.]
MKKIIGLAIIVAIGVFSIPVSFTSCTDVSGDGIDSLYYSGSTLPQNSSYRNPVWEPDFELGTVFKGATSYTGIGSETQWTGGITYCAPVISSNNLMDWKFNSITAFPLVNDTVVSGTETTVYKRPDWAEGRIQSMTAGFARTIASTSYWLFYQIDGHQAIGAACAKAPQGPYSDLGKLIDNTNTVSTSLQDPFFIVVGTRFYLFYTTETGTYVQELTLRRSQLPTLRNAPVKVSEAGFGDVSVYRKDNYFYLLGIVENGSGTEIRYGRSTAVTGPYADKDGNELLSGTGTLLIENGVQLVNPNNVCGVFADINNDDFILYNVTDLLKPVMGSGFNRRPLAMDKLDMDEDGWFGGTVKPMTGWTSPMFIDK